MSTITNLLTEALVILFIAIAVRAVAARFDALPYTALLVLVGGVASAFGAGTRLRISPDIILTLLLPAVLFWGAAETKSSYFRETLPIGIALAVVGLPATVLLVGVVGEYVFGVPFMFALLFAAIISPIDPVSVITVFREVDAPERLSVLAESESHLADGLAIVIFSSVFDLMQTQLETGAELGGLLTWSKLLDMGADIVLVSVGGLAVGVVAGGVALVALRVVTERMNELLLMVVLPYASFLLAHHYLHVSGVLATVAAGLVLGTYGPGAHLNGADFETFETIWEAVTFLITTLLFLVVGIKVPARRLLAYGGTVLTAYAVVLLARAVVVYALLTAVDWLEYVTVPMQFRHVLVWGGMRTVVPIALLLTLPQQIPLREQLGAMVFGIAVLSIAVQGLVLPYVLRATSS